MPTLDQTGLAGSRPWENLSMERSMTTNCAYCLSLLPTTPVAVLDYVLINAQFQSSLQDIHSMGAPGFGFDHYLVHAWIRLKQRRVRKMEPKTPRLDWTSRSPFLMVLSPWPLWMMRMKKSKRSLRPSSNVPSLPDAELSRGFQMRILTWWSRAKRQSMSIPNGFVS